MFVWKTAAPDTLRIAWETAALLVRAELTAIDEHRHTTAEDFLASAHGLTHELHELGRDDRGDDALGSSRFSAVMAAMWRD